MNSLPTGILETDALIQQFDTCLMTGFTNLGSEQEQSLQSLNRVLTGTPLGGSLAEAIEALSTSNFLPRHFQVLASARLALQGAQYQALQACIRENLGRNSENFPSPEIHFTEASPLQNSVAHWLMDMAIAGFSRLELASVTAFSATLSQLQSHQSLMPLATLLTGFMQELIGAVPIKSGDKAPLFRWADLWSRAFVISLQQSQVSAASPISGKLHLLGIDWRQHAFMTSLVSYGLLETENQLRLVRINESAYKVDAISYEEQWLLFPKMAMLVESLESGQCLLLENMPLLPTGDLLWDTDAATMGEKYKLMQIAEQCFAPSARETVQMPSLPAHQYHPVHLAEPVFLKIRNIQDWAISDGNYSFDLDMNRIIDTELSQVHLIGCDSAFGLLRYDAQAWRFQPLTAAKGKGKLIFTGKDSTKLFKTAPKTSTLSILQERASRLLRE